MKIGWLTLSSISSMIFCDFTPSSRISMNTFNNFSQSLKQTWMLLIVSLFCLFDLGLHQPQDFLLVLAEIQTISSHFLSAAHQVKEGFAVVTVFKQDTEVHWHGEFYHPQQTFLYPFYSVSSCYAETTLSIMANTLKTLKFLLIKFSSFKWRDLISSLYSSIKSFIPECALDQTHPFICCPSSFCLKSATYPLNRLISSCCSALTFSRDSIYNLFFALAYLQTCLFSFLIPFLFLLNQWLQLLIAANCFVQYPLLFVRTGFYGVICIGYKVIRIQLLFSGRIVGYEYHQEKNHKESKVCTSGKVRGRCNFYSQV